MLQQNHPLCFKSTKAKSVACSELSNNGSVITDPDDLLTCWFDYFSSLRQSQCNSSDHLLRSKEKLNNLNITSLEESDKILDFDIIDEEIEYTICKLKQNCAGGPDNVSPLSSVTPYLRIGSVKSVLRSRMLALCNPLES